MSGRGGKATDSRADRGGKDADTGADGRTGPTRHAHADGWKRRGRGPGGADEAQQARTGGRVDKQTSGRADRRTGRSGGRADGRTGEDGRTGSPPVGRIGGRADGRTSGWAWV